AGIDRCAGSRPEPCRGVTAGLVVVAEGYLHTAPARRGAHDPAVIGTAISGESSEGGVDTIVREGEGRSLLLDMWIEAGRCDRDLGKARQAGLQVKPYQVVIGGLLHRHGVDDAGQRVDHGCTQDPDWIDVPAWERRIRRRDRR